jgi:DNA replication licensing factor MCM2
MSGRGSQNGSDHASKRARHGDDDTEDPQPLSSTGGPVDAQDGALSQSEDDPRTPMTPFSPDNDDDDQDMAVNGEDLVPFGEGADDRADGGDPEEEEEGEDLFGDDMVNDYGEKAELDRYEVDQVAEEDDVEDMSIAARRQADREMRQRDEMRRLLAAGGNSNRLNNEDSDAEEDDQMGRRRRRRNNALVARYRTSRQQQQRDTPVSGGAASPYGSVPGSASQGGGSGGTPSNFQDEDALEHDPDFELEANDGTPLRDWINLDKVRIEIYRRCTAFMRTFTADKTGALVYMDRIRLMGASNSQTLVVNYPNFFSTEPNISIWLADEPAGILAIFNEAATDVTLSVFPEYGLIHPEIFVRIASLPVMDQLRDIRHIHLNTLIKVSGVVTRRSGVFPHLRVVKLNCEKCQSVLAPTATSNARPERSIALCPECGSRGPFTVNSEQTLFGNYQKLNLQESPGKVPAGRLPRYKEVILLNDLIDTARPGDEVEVTGIYRHNVDPTINIMNGFPVFSTVIEANFVRKVEDAHAETELTDDDIKDIRALSQDPRIAERVFASIAPSIYGHANIKRALALALFGGQAKEVGERHRMRGDINVLMMGDPGTAKSQFLKYVEKTAHRAVYTTGKGASAVGLTAGVHKDPVTREWTLEGGALVLADRGVCLIDEFDKMNDADRTSIHEAMEQQSISISKAGIVTTLQARCSVFAAANPVRGRYDASKSFFDNVDLTEPILSRFDVLCVVRDTVDPTVDETLAKFVVDSHMRSHPDAQDIASESNILDDKDGVDTKVADVGMRFSDSGVELIPQELLRKYILFAKSTVSPRLANIDNNKITSLYLDLRKESMASGGMPIALRHLESIVRLAEAHARLHLRDYVREDDVNAAISVMLESFFTSQKYAVMRNLRSHFHKYLAYRKDDNDLLFYVLSGLVRDYAATQARDLTGTGAPATVEVDLEDFEARAREMNVHSCQKFYGSALFEQRRFSLDGERRKIIKTL